MSNPTVVIVCDALCLSKARLERELKNLQQDLPAFQFRFAKNQEIQDLLGQYRPVILPMAVCNGQSLIGVLDAKTLSHWLNRQIQNSMSAG